MSVFKDSKTVPVDKPRSDWVKGVFLSATVTVAVAIMMAFLAGCSVYKSNGRSSFEERAPGNLTTQSLSLESTDGTCWTQPSREPLWELPDQEEVRVRLISDDLLEVCLVAGE